MLKTRITELFGMKHPIVLAGMNWITEPNLVATVCNAGGLGLLATAQYSPEDARKNIRQIKELTDKPFGINQILTGPRGTENVAVAIEEKVPIINYSLGRPGFIDQVHAYGGKVIGTIAIARHAVRAEQMGVDALIVTGHEAAAHGADATSLVLIPLVASQVKIPLVAAGGFSDGRGLAAALALGADAISMGTRFMITKESVLHDNFKRLLIEATEQDTLYSDVFDGMPGRALKSKAADELMKGDFNLGEAIPSALQVKRLLKMSWWQFILTSYRMMKGEERRNLFQQARMARTAGRQQKAIYNGDVDEGVLFAGQVTGAIRDIPTCQELVERIVAEAEQMLESARAKVVA